MITYTAGELFALQPTDVTIPRTVRKSSFDLDFGVRANNGCSVTREFRHMTCFPAQTQLITVSQQNTRRCQLSAVIIHHLQFFDCLNTRWLLKSTTMLLNCVVTDSAKHIRRCRLNCVVTDSAKHIRRCRRDLENALEMGDAMP